MPINTQHEEYKAAATQVERVNDCFKGSDAIKSKGKQYLPMLDEQTTDKYNKYKHRGYFLPAVKPASVALTGAIMRKELTVDIPTSLNVLVGNGNQDLTDLASMMISQLMITGKGGLLIEHNGIDPVFKFYNRQSIINWSSNYVILCQSYTEQDENDPYVNEHKTEYLELILIDGIYTQRVWRQANGKEWKIFSVITPSKRGDAITSIPFIFFNTMSAENSNTPPALLELADVNLDHYRMATDLRHGLHYTALPTMFLFGDIRDDQNQPVDIVVGAGSANHIPDTDGRAELLEFTGSGLGAISSAMQEDVNQMAAIGAKMFGSTQLGVKAAETARIESSGESATLSTIANSVESALTQAYIIAAEWQSINGAGISVRLNRDFLDSRLSAPDITALLSSYIQGGISIDTFLFNIQKGDLLQKGVTIEEEKAKINGGELGLA